MKVKNFKSTTYEKTVAYLLTGVLFFTSLVSLILLNLTNTYAAEETDLEADIYVNLSDFTMTVDGNTNEIKTYTLEDYDTFLEDYNNNNFAVFAFLQTGKE